MGQLSFFNLLPDTYWVELKPGIGQRFWKPGQRFLVIEKNACGDALLCWPDGIPPKMWPLTRGNLINPEDVQEVNNHEH